MNSSNPKSPKLPLQNLLNIAFSPKSHINPPLLRHNTFLISDKIIEKSIKPCPKVLISNFYQLKKPKNLEIRLKTAPNSSKGRNSLINLLKIDSPSKKKPLIMHTEGDYRGKIHDLRIYSDLKEECRELLQNSSKKHIKIKEKTEKILKFSMLKELQNEYYQLQKISIEKYLKGSNVNTNLIEMDFFEFLKLKKNRLLDYISENEIKREITPIEKIISQNELAFQKENMKKKAEKEEKQRKNLDFLNELIKKPNEKTTDFLDKKKDQIYQKMQLYNQYYLNYFTPPSNPNQYFTTLKDLSLNRLSISKDLIDKSPQTLQKASFSHFHQKTAILKDFSQRAGKNMKNFNDDLLGKGWKILGEKLEGKIGVIDSVKKQMESEGVEYVKKEREEMLMWKKGFQEKKKLGRDEREFLMAVKAGDLKKVQFFLIDNKGLLEIIDQVY